MGIYHADNSGGRIIGSGSLQVLGLAPPESGFDSFMDGYPGLSAAQRAPDAAALQ